MDFSPLVTPLCITDVRPQTPPPSRAVIHAQNQSIWILDDIMLPITMMTNLTMTMTTEYFQVLSCLGTDLALRYESNQATELPDQLRLQHPSITIQATTNLDKLNCIHGQHT